MTPFKLNVYSFYFTFLYFAGGIEGPDPSENFTCYVEGDQFSFSLLTSRRKCTFKSVFWTRVDMVSGSMIDYEC